VPGSTQWTDTPVPHAAGRILVAHVADIEKAFLGRWLAPVGYQPTRVIDTDVLSRLVIARRGGPLVEAHVGLGAVCAHFGLPEHRRHHALGDAVTTAQLFLATASLLVPEDQASVAQLLSAGRALRSERRRRWIRRTGDLMHRSPATRG
jgi:DNA polymerase-3 subunit epsilon